MPFHADTLSTATPISLVGGMFSDTFNINFADVDMFAVTLQGGRAYEIDIDGGNDSYLRVFDLLGREMRANDDGAASNEVLATQPYMQFYAPYSGTYYVALSPYYLTDYNPATTDGRVSPENPLVAADSTLNLIDLGGEFFPDSGAINSIVANGSADDTSMLANADGNGRQRLEYHDATSVVAAGDVEMGRFDLRKGDVVAVDVNGYVPGSIDNLSSVVRVFNSAGTQIAFDSGSGVDEDSELVFAARTTGAYYIAVSGQGNASYNGLDGTGTLTGDSGFFTAVLHLNPTSIGSSAAQTLNGTAGDDYIVLMAGDDTSAGGDGADTVSGGDENDTISGVAGNDYLYGDSGDDALNGGNGDDILIGGYGIDALAGSNDNDLLDGGDGNDSLNGGNNDDVLFGGAGLDVLNGGNGDDTLDGGNDNDSLSGDANNDTIEGGAGNDTLRGGTGNDRQTGGSGNDVHLGGAGADTFVFTGSTQGNDRIDDWVAVDDQLEIDASAFGGGLVAGGLAANQLVVGSAPVATQAFGQFLYNTTNGQLSWDDDGTGAGAAIAITRLLNGGLAVGTLAVGDFDIVA